MLTGPMPCNFIFVSFHITSDWLRSHRITKFSVLTWVVSHESQLQVTHLANNKITPSIMSLSGYLSGD